MARVGSLSTYYLSGPMTGIPGFNFPAFTRAAQYLRNVAGYKVLSAHEIDHGVEPGDILWNEYLRNDLIQMLQRCDSIIFLPGWMDSKGARLEYLVASSLHWPCFTFDIEDEVPDIVPFSKADFLDRLDS